MKIFQIGFNKCGTTSIHRHLQSLGLNSIHYDEGRLAQCMQHNVDSEEHILTGIEQYDAYSDMVFISNNVHIEAFKSFELIHEQVPDAIFIYNTRDKQKWLQSCIDHPRFVERMCSVYGYTTEMEVVEHWSRDWDTHFSNVTQRIPLDKLLVFNIEKSETREINRFLGFDCDTDEGKLRVYNYTDGPLYRLARTLTPRPLKRLTPARVRTIFRYALRTRR